ncbi:MAG: S-layer homology domain-containing protein, partial [Clostridiales bacterium]|nr:S-layer homology domain-containing protein [Clostridiales bacterium]
MTEKDKLDSVNQFSDMDVHWSKNDVGALTHLEIINGFPDRTFRPNATLQLYQFLKLAIEAMGHQLEQGFEEYWAINHINMAFFEGLIREGEYDLDNHDRFKQPITRQEMARIMSRALLSRWIMPHYTELEIIEEEIIKDIRTVTNEFRHYIILAYSFGLLKGRTEGNFEPHAHLTRAEGATVITRFIDEDLRETIKPDLSHKKQVTLFTGHSRFIIGKDGVHHVWQTIYECKREPDIIDMLI